MSRSQPQKRKPRCARRTAQIVVEGFTEEAFCKHLKALYARDCGVRVEIHNARGGSPQDVIRSAIKRRGFDRTLVLFDTDRPLPAVWHRKALANGYQLVTPSPCIEAFLLELLGHPLPGDTAACKRAFDAVLPPPGKYLPEPYAEHFPDTLLRHAQSPLLKQLLSAFRP
ncbi:hypothetical protein [Haloferula sp. A504]|uniref:hypothetical protein n=1 Tax=Haloferula sp. A504 TaxID=3373601 RepID=UPI0031C8100D|nr:hypothetical protein [Verrucomicrobiaceae bacterium E54]